jgi:2-keto-4-pentenoate hydratase
LPEDCRPTSRTEAYAIQDAMARALGLAVAGWKLGMSAPETMRKFGVDEPVPGRIFRECVHQNGATIAAGIYAGPKVEPEFAVRLKTALPPRKEPYSRADVVAATEAILLCFEVADNRVAPPRPDPLSMIADNGGFAAYVIGPAVKNWQAVDFKTVGVELLIDGKLAAKGLEGEGRIDPIDVALWTANNLSRRGHGLAAGDLISTGSATAPTPMKVGSSALGRFAGLGEVKVTFKS